MTSNDRFPFGGCWVRAGVAAVFGLWLVSCGGQAPPPTDVQGRYEPDSGKLVSLALDSNRDGRADMTASMDGARVRTVEVDEDYDGRADRWEFYESPAALDSSQRPEPKLVRVERAVRRSGREMRREAFVDGVLAWVHEDRDGDGRTDRWETYADGGLSTVELDSDGSGKPDRRLRYEADRMLVELDPQETGVFTPARAEP